MVKGIKSRTVIVEGEEALRLLEAQSKVSPDITVVPIKLNVEVTDPFSIEDGIVKLLQGTALLVESGNRRILIFTEPIPEEPGSELYMEILGKVKAVTEADIVVEDVYAMDEVLLEEDAEKFEPLVRRSYSAFLQIEIIC